jgi:hypothetical protein
MSVTTLPDDLNTLAAVITSPTKASVLSLSAGLTEIYNVKRPMREGTLEAHFVSHVPERPCKTHGTC